MITKTQIQFIITCVVHYEDGYIVGLILLPILLFVVETALRYSWHALLIGWNMASDKNGNVEALDKKGIKKVIKKLKRETKYLLRRQAKEYSKIKRKTAILLKNEKKKDSETSELREETPPNGKKKDTLDVGKDVLQMTRIESASIDYTGPSAGGAGNDSSGGISRQETGQSTKEEEKKMDDEIHATLIDADVAHLFEFDSSEIERKLKHAIRKHRSVIVGDFFIGTCWRLQVVFSTVIMAMVATYLLDSVCFFLTLFV